MSHPAVEPGFYEELVQPLLDAIRPRGKSLIMTVYGDAILPHGGGAWLGGLIQLLAPLGLNERIVRTSMFRLAQDELVAATQSGRRSFYALTENGTRQSMRAARRIYAPRDARWDGTWTQVWIPEHGPEVTQRKLIQELTWLGFARTGPGMFIHLGQALDAARETIRSNDQEDRVMILTAASAVPDEGQCGTREFVANTWPLDALGADYADFLMLASPIHAALADNGIPDPMTCFALRVLLVHAYRRIVLRDPMLPRDLLDPDWPGLEAEAMMKELYCTLCWPAQHHVMRELAGLDTAFKAPDKVFKRRYVER